MLKYTNDLNRKTGNRLRILLPVFLLLIGICSAAAQNENRAVFINSISVLIDGSPGEAEIYDLITIKPGDKLSYNKINHSIKQIYKSSHLRGKCVMNNCHCILQFSCCCTTCKACTNNDCIVSINWNTH